MWNETVVVHSDVLCPSLPGGMRKTAKGHPKSCKDGKEGDERYSSTLSLTSALDGVDGQRHAPAALLSGMRPGNHCTGSGVRSQGRSGRLQKISPPTLIRSTDLRELL
jgi:hypothetical protein